MRFRARPIMFMKTARSTMSKSTGRLIPNPLPTIANRTGRLIGEEELQQLREVIDQAP